MNGLYKAYYSDAAVLRGASQTFCWDKVIILGLLSDQGHA